MDEKGFRYYEINTQNKRCKTESPYTAKINAWVQADRKQTQKTGSTNTRIFKHGNSSVTWIGICKVKHICHDDAVFW